MHVIGFDPGLTVEGAAQLSPGVRRVDALEDLTKEAEFLTVHVPLSASTRHLIGADQIAALTKGAVVHNFAREGIIDEAAAVAAPGAGHLTSYVSDFPVNLTRRQPNCVTQPPLRASP